MKYPNKLVDQFTNTKPQNASMLYIVHPEENIAIYFEKETGYLYAMRKATLQVL